MANTPTRYIYGPVHSWRSGTSLGVDPIGEISTCSFNCAYCQLGQIQRVTTEVSEYVPTAAIIKDFKELSSGVELADHPGFKLEDLDVITFAGSGEPTLAANLAEIITELREVMSETGKQVPISILTNATLFNDEQVRRSALVADHISLKLDAANDLALKSINQADASLSIDSICEGIKVLLKDIEGMPLEARPQVQLQLMFMPKYVCNEAYITELAERIIDLGITRMQINTPTRPKPKGKDYHIETRGNHYAKGMKKGSAAVVEDVVEIEYTELPAISKEEAFSLEAKLRELIEPKLSQLEIVNVYKAD